MPHKSRDNLLKQIDDIACLKAGFPSLKIGIIDAVNMLKERDLRRKISDNDMREELSQERAMQMPIPLRAIKLCIELLARIALGDPSALKERKEFHQKWEPALVVSTFFKQQGEALNMFTGEERYQLFIDDTITPW